MVILDTQSNFTVLLQVTEWSGFVSVATVAEDHRWANVNVQANQLYSTSLTSTIWLCFLSQSVQGLLLHVLMKHGHTA